MNKLITIAVIATGVYLVTKSKDLSNEPRGIRNNNPGNIRLGARWQGMAEVQQDSAFITFKSPEYGIRAMARVLNNYQKLHGIGTIEGIIGRWAPSSENDTGSYIRSVSKALSIPASQPLVVANVLPELIPAIIKHENGKQPYSDSQIREGIALA